MKEFFYTIYDFFMNTFVRLDPSYRYIVATILFAFGLFLFSRGLKKTKQELKKPPILTYLFAVIFFAWGALICTV